MWEAELLLLVDARRLLVGLGVAGHLHLALEEGAFGDDDARGRDVSFERAGGQNFDALSALDVPVDLAGDAHRARRDLPANRAAGADHRAAVDAQLAFELAVDDHFGVTGN